MQEYQSRDENAKNARNEKEKRENRGRVGAMTAPKAWQQDSGLGLVRADLGQCAKKLLSQLHERAGRVAIKALTTWPFCQPCSGSD